MLIIAGRQLSRVLSNAREHVGAVMILPLIEWILGLVRREFVQQPTARRLSKQRLGIEYFPLQ